MYDAPPSELAAGGVKLPSETPNMTSNVHPGIAVTAAPVLLFAAGARGNYLS